MPVPALMGSLSLIQPRLLIAVTQRLAISDRKQQMIIIRTNRCGCCWETQEEVDI